MPGGARDAARPDCAELCGLSSGLMSVGCPGGILSRGGAWSEPPCGQGHSDSWIGVTECGWSGERAEAGEGGAVRRPSQCEVKVTLTGAGG